MVESLVVSLETAKKLKVAGFPQDAVMHCWAHTDYGLNLVMVSNDANLGHELGLTGPAPTAQEIADQLTKYRYEKLDWEEKTAWLTITVDKGGKWTAGYCDVAGNWLQDISVEGCDTLAEALAALYLKLHHE